MKEQSIHKIRINRLKYVENRPVDDSYIRKNRIAIDAHGMGK